MQRDAAGAGIVTADVEPGRVSQPSLQADEIAELVRVARALERAAGSPQDAEFAVVAGTAPENVQLLQCRPETVWSRKAPKAVAAGRTAMESVLAALTGKAG
jgi:pyruvate,water dikinase